MSILLTPLESYKQRHLEAIKKLMDTFKKLEDTGTSVYEQIGQSLNKTGQTVRNYISGGGSDGFLTEAITLEIEKLITEAELKEIMTSDTDKQLEKHL